MMSSEPIQAISSRVQVPLRIRLLGGFEVSAGSQSIDAAAWRLRKAGHLVKLLALEPGHQLHREQIIDILWPESSPQAGASNLRYALHIARRTIGQLPVSSGDLLQMQHGQIALYPAGQVWVDVEEFESAAAAARQTTNPARYQAALACYPGDLLPEDRYEDWAAGPRERLREIQLELRRELAGLLDQEGLLDEAIDALKDVILVEPGDEAAHAHLMKMYARSGRRQQALRQFQQLRQTLRDELEVEPEPATQRLYADILTGQLPSTRDQPAVERWPPEASPGNLPAPLTRFIGRQDAITQVPEMFATSRLVTLTGPGGAGKTRLAIEAARGMTEDSPNGVWVIDLAPVSAAGSIFATAASTLSVAEAGSEDLDAALIDALRTSRSLLVLDNCEHLLDACAHFAQRVLSECPYLRLLATSRAALHVPGEVIWQVPPLSLPGDLERASPGEAAASEAVQLFCDRARLAQPSFVLTMDNAEDVSQICRKLDGQPLAIELAAARLPALGSGQLRDRLDDALAVLTGGARTYLPRHQTLRATLDWSHDLLDAGEQVVFRRLAVFAGGWSLGAAEAVVEGDGVASRDVLHTLAQLVDKSLVVVDARSDAVRYRFLETVRQYAAEQLGASGERDDVQQRHAAWCLIYAEAGELGLRGDAQARWLERLRLDIDNLRAALGWYEQRGQLEEQLRLGAALVRFWWIRGYPSEGRRWLRPVVDGKGARGIDPAVRSKALAALGNLAAQQGDLSRAQALLEECLRLERERGHSEAIADALNHLGAALMELGQLQRAKDLVEESLALRRALGDARDIALSLGALGGISFAEADYEQSIRYFEEALRLYRAAGDRHSVAITLNNLGEALRARGDVDRAMTLFEESLDLFRRLEARHGVAFLLANLGDLSRTVGRHQEARTRYLEALDLFCELGYQQMLLKVVAGLAALIAGSWPHLAVELFGAEDALRASGGSGLPAGEQAEYERAIALARAGLDDAAFARLWEQGRALSLDEAVERAAAIQVDDVAAESAPDALDTGDLSRREREVALLISAGRTNREIAAELGVAPRTVDTHVSNILRKLGLPSRAEVAAWIAAHHSTPDGKPGAG